MFRVSSIVKFKKCFVIGTSQRALLSGASNVSADDVVNNQNTSNNLTYHRGQEDDILNQIREEDRHYARLVSLENDHHARMLSLLSKNKCSQQKEQSIFIQHSNTQQKDAIHFYNKRNNQESDLCVASQKVDVVPFLPSIPKIGRISITPHEFKAQVKKNDDISPSLAKLFVESLVASIHDADAVCEYFSTLFDIMHTVDFGCWRDFDGESFSKAGLGNVLPAIISAHANNVNVVNHIREIFAEYPTNFIKDLFDAIDQPDYDGAIFDAITLVCAERNDSNKSVNIRMACSLIMSNCSRSATELMKKRGFVAMLKKLKESPHSHTFSRGVDDAIEKLETEEGEYFEL